MEQAQLFAHLGTTVTMVGRLAPRTESELAASLHAVFDVDKGTVVAERGRCRAGRAEGRCGSCVVVDAEQRTSNPKVFAAGDVTDARYVYVAAATGKAAASNALGGHDGVDYAGMPTVVFTRPAAGICRAHRSRGARSRSSLH
jgi:mercuric reductase